MQLLLTVQYGGGCDDQSPVFTISERPRKKAFPHHEGGLPAVEELTWDLHLEPKFHGLNMQTAISCLEFTFNSILRDVESRFSKNDWLDFFINHPDLYLGIRVPPTQIGLVTADTIMSEIRATLSSKENLCLSSDMTVSMSLARFPKGRGLGRPIYNIMTQLKCKRSVVEINNVDNLCMFRAVAVGWANFLHRTDPDSPIGSKYKSIRNGDQGRASSAQLSLALELCEEIGHDPNEEGSIEQLRDLEDYIELGIVVFNGTLQNHIMYASTENEYDRHIFLLYVNDNGRGHFHTIVNVPAYMAKDNFCPSCLKSTGNTHSCKFSCRVCQSQGCIFNPETVQPPCVDCNFHARSRACYQRHIDKQLCQTFYRCVTCSVRVKRTDEDRHVCGNFKCYNCKRTGPREGHQCYFKREEPLNSVSKFLFYDFETEHVTHHVPTFVAFQTSCDQCEDGEEIKETDVCENCGLPGNRLRAGSFAGENTTQLFTEMLFSEHFMGYTIVAHNSRAFDSTFLVNAAISQGSKVNVLLRGNKIMKMNLTALRQRHIDSLNHIPMALSALPKTFGFQEAVKGYFPHALNSIDNIGKILPFPDKDLYEPDRMKPDGRAKFIEWYDQQDKSRGFNYDLELAKYCANDVSILRRAVYKYRCIFREVTATTRRVKKNGVETTESFDLDPFAYTTIAASCQAVFKAKFLSEQICLVTAEELKSASSSNRDPDWVFGERRPGGEVYVDGQLTEIALTDKGKEMWKLLKSDIAKPSNEDMYLRKNTFSAESISWLEWEAKNRGIYITHALNGTEKSITNPASGRSYLLDGYFQDPVTGVETVFEYDGCVWHGCDKCFPNLQADSSIRVSMLLQQRNKLTEAKNRFLNEQYPGQVVVMRSCEWLTVKSENAEIADFVQKLRIPERLRARGTFFGGRTEVFTTLKSGAEMYYYDFTSLYPDVNKVKL